MADIPALIAKLEAATEPSRELDAAIQVAIYGGRVWEKDARCFAASDGIPRFAPLYTASLDAALTLVPPVLGIMWYVDKYPDESAAAFVGQRDSPVCQFNVVPTPALALCIAALKARRANY